MNRHELVTQGGEVTDLARNSRGAYRIPYQSGTTVEVRRDHLNHDPPNRIDLKGRGPGAPYRTARRS
jgi:hypothetical protein